MIERLKFGQRRYEADGKLPLWLGWAAESSDLHEYLDILLKSFQRSDRLQAALVNLSGGNARRALELVTEFIESPHSDPDILLERNKGDHPYLVPHHVFLRAVLLGSARHYHPGQSLIPNVFDISTADPREHFLLPSILGLLRRAAEHSDVEGYMPVGDIYASFQEAGFFPDQVDFALRRARAGDFVDPLPPDGDPRALRITMAGAYAHQLPAEFQYVDVVIIDTPIADPVVRGELKVVHAVRARLERTERFVQYLDAAWDAADLDTMGLVDWSSCAATVRNEIENISARL